MSLLNTNPTVVSTSTDMQHTDNANTNALTSVPAHIHDWFKVNALYYGDGKGNFDTLDSLERIKFNMAIEDEFAIVIDDDSETEKFKSIDEYVKFVEMHLSQQRNSML